METIKKAGILFLIATLLLSNSACRRRAPVGDENLSERLSKKKDITILVTDSGLGGLSVVGDLAARLPKSGIFRSARVVFFSSLFKERSGYNSLKNDSDKARIFQIVLEAMEKKYAPDLLLIGCTTLSIVYHDTPFSKKPKFPVVGIVEAGAKLIAGQFERTPEATAIVFATRTTIESEAHKNWLVEHGYPAEKIIGQACHRLAGAINRGYQSEETMGLIRQYIAAALASLSDPGAPLFVSLNCTDYGYSIAQFRQVFAESGYKEVSIIDPNSRLADFLFSAPRLHRFSETQVTVEVVSKTQITEDMIASVGSVLESLSPQTAEALRRYRHEPGLFDPRLEGLEFID